MAGVVKAVWIHQFDLAGLASWDQIRATWPGQVYVKAADSTDWMSQFDSNPLAVNDHLGRLDGPSWTWLGERATPWVVPTGAKPNEEGLLAADLDLVADEVILDVEPYIHFWKATNEDAATFVDAFSSKALHGLALSIDYRRLPFPPEVLHQAAARYLPEVYWDTFHRPWRQVLEECAAALSPYGRPIEYVLPGAATTIELAAALSWVKDHGATASIWVWQDISPDNWDVIRSYADDEAPAGPTSDDLINLLGYLQGDVATAIEGPLLQIQQAGINPPLDVPLGAALDAVRTLRTAGK